MEAAAAPPAHHKPVIIFLMTLSGSLKLFLSGQIVLGIKKNQPKCAFRLGLHQSFKFTGFLLKSIVYSFHTKVGRKYISFRK